MDGIRSVGLEFYGEDSSKAFPSLETLCFENMQEWEEWSHPQLHQNVEQFSCLSELSINSCPKLLGTLPNTLISLKKLHIGECEQLALSIQGLPLLCQLEIRGCKEIVCRSKADIDSLNIVAISRISKFIGLTNGFMTWLKKVEKLEIGNCEEQTVLWQNEIDLLHGLNSLRHLEIKDCPELISLVSEAEGEIGAQQHQWQRFTLESLVLHECKKFEKLPRWLHWLRSLQELKIKDCPRLSFPMEGMPSALRQLEIIGCHGVESLPNMGLEFVNIDNCDSVKFIGWGQLLRVLYISNCRNLEYCFLEDGSSTSCIESLTISGCPSLTSLSSRGELPATLKYLRVDYCPKLESIAKRLSNNTSLESFYVYNCENLKWLPEGLQALQKLSNLKIFKISGCPNLVSFREGGLPVANLTELKISNCEQLVALPDQIRNVTSLSMANLDFWKPLFNRGLHRLTYLRELTVAGKFCPGEIGSSTNQDDHLHLMGLMLPTSLTRLQMYNFPNLEHLSFRGFHRLTSLETLVIDNCPKLRSFPREGLPNSLLQLKIFSCPLLQQRCKKDKGKYWPMIAYIPYVQMC